MKHHYLHCHRSVRNFILMPILCVAAMAFLPALPVSAADNTADNCGIFLWRSIELVDEPALMDEFFEICERNGINHVYCFISRDKDKRFYLEKFNAQFFDFFKRCHSAKIKVWALMGSNEWLDESFRDEITALNTNLRFFNDQCATYSISGIEGVMLDIEPHSLPGWKDPQSREQLCSKYLSVISFARKDAKLPLALSVPYKYNGIALKDSSGDLLSEIFRRTDRITFMAYLNRYDLIMNKMLPIVRRKDLTIPFEVALETAYVKDAEPYISFYGKGISYFRSTSDKCKKDFAGIRNFYGMVIHDYKGLKQLGSE